MQKGKKYLHYCWFGDKKLPGSAKRYMRTWKKFLPDYEIVCWSENNIDLEECPFIKEAYEQKKWAFVADYARVKALYEYGGIYLDTDIAIKKNVDFLLDDSAFVGVEDSGYVAAGVWGAKKPGSYLAGEVLKFYRSQSHFDSSDLYAITIPRIMTEILERDGFRKQVNEIQEVHNTYIYPREYFYPLSYDHENNVFTDKTCMVHYSDASWTSKAEKRDIRLIRMLGRRRAGIIIKMIGKFKALALYYWKVVWRTIMLITYPVRFVLRKVNRRTISDLTIDALSAINKNKSSYLAFTHEGWIGIEASTRELFGNTVMIGDFDQTSDFEQIVGAVTGNKDIKMVVFSGFGQGWEYLACKIKEANPDIVLKVFWHGSNAMHIEAFDWERFETVFGLLNDGIIDSVAFAKKSMYEQYRKLGYDVEFLPNTVTIDKNTKKALGSKTKHDEIRVGVYASGDRWVKNLYNQMAAASLVDDAVVDMVPMSDVVMRFAKLLKIQINGERGKIPHSDMLKRILHDDIVLYATFVECAPMMPLECMELGTLCITGDNHHYWEGTKLEEYLVEPKVDNPVAIAQRVKKCLKHKDEIMKLYAEWKKDYDKYCKKELKKFLEV